MSETHELKPDFALTGKVVFITGASRGIGRACALACAAAGADLCLALRDVDSGSEVISIIERMGRKAIGVSLDLSCTDQVPAALMAAMKHFGRIDVLINNVGVAPGNPAESVTEADFDLTVAVNLKGTFFLTQAVAKQMILRGGGRIINMSSQAGTVTLHGESIYCMTKAAINHLTRCLALEWAKHKITVNSVAPTFVWTDSTKPALADKQFLAQTIAHIPLGRIGETQDVTGSVVFLASPAGAFITGTNLLVDGGWSIA